MAEADPRHAAHLVSPQQMHYAIAGMGFFLFVVFGDAFVPAMLPMVCGWPVLLVTAFVAGVAGIRACFGLRARTRRPTSPAEPAA